MSQAKGSLSKYCRVFLWAIVLAVVIYLVVRNIGVFGNIVLVVFGFGAVVLVHEFGHFVVAKLSGIKVEAFSIGFPPMLAGILRTEKGWRVRILPRFFPKQGDKSGDGRLNFTIGSKAKQGETEYRIGVIPVGGFVKMLGQEDTGPVKSSDDPRSYANKPVGVRMAVITAGVVFNAISAIFVFMIVFLVGIRLPPAVVGSVMPDSPAARAGLRPGDEIIEVAGKSNNLDFSHIAVAAALSDVNEAVPLKVKHEDGSIEDFALVAEQLRGEPMRAFGIWPARILTIAEVTDPDKLYSKTGLLPGDLIKSVNGKEVQSYWELVEVVKNTYAAEVTLLAERTDETGALKLVESHIGLDLMSTNKLEVKSEYDLSHIYSMVPRLRIASVEDGPASVKEKLISLLDKIGIKKTVADSGHKLQSGDIILAIGDVENPTYKEMQNVTTDYEDKELPIKVLRSDANGVEKALTVTVELRRLPGSDKVLIGIGVVLDAEHPVVAKTISTGSGLEKLKIPRGAVITAVDNTRVSNFYDVIREIRRYPGQRIPIDWRVEQKIAGDVALDVGVPEDFITVKSTFAEYVPFEDLRRLYKASGPFDAIKMGCRKTIMFIVQTYATLKGLIVGLINPKTAFMGPVGIIALSYNVVAHQPLIYYLYLLGLISAVIAVFNFLPLPPFDGGLVVLLLVEKIKGSALSERTQGIIAYAGWVLVGSFILYVTFNDIVRSFFS